MMASSLEARLQYLETREEAHTRDIIRLKTENAELQTTVCELKRENLQIHSKIKTMDSENAELQTKVCELKRENLQTTEKLAEIHSKIKKVDSENAEFQTKVCELKRENLQTTEKVAEIHSKIQKVDSENAELQTKVCELKQERALVAAKPVEAETKIMKVENKGNADLVTKVWELKQETVLAVAKLEGAETKIQKVENDLRAVFGFRENIDSRLSCVELKLMSTKEGEDRLNSLETIMNTLRQEVMTAPTPKHPDSAKGSGEMDVESRLKKTEENLKVSQEKFENRLRKVEQLEGIGGLAQASAHPQQGLVSNMEMLELQKNVKHLLEVKDAISKSVVRVSLEPEHKPRTNQRVKLVKCKSSWINGGYFNENSCCLEPPVAGVFAIFFSFCQGGHGDIFVQFGSTSEALNGQYVAATFQINDVRSNLVIARLGKGDKVWLEMERHEGNANLHWCNLTSWLISPSL